MYAPLTQLALALVSFLLCAAQNSPPAGGIYNEINGNCPTVSMEPSSLTGMVIWPADGYATNSTVMDATRDTINTYLSNPSERDFWNYTSTVDGVLLWYAYLNNEQACDIAAFSGVSVPSLSM